LSFILEYEAFKTEHPAYESSNISPSQLILNGVHKILLLKRLSKAKKLEYVFSKLNQAVGLFDALRETWKTASRVSLEDTIPQLRGIEKPLRSMVAPLLEEFPARRSATDEVISRIAAKAEEFAGWLESDVSSRVDCDIRTLDREIYEELLRIRMEGHTWSQRLEIGEGALEESKQRLEKLAIEVDASGTVDAALEIAKNDQPECSVLEEAREVNRLAAEFLLKKRLLRLPEGTFDIIEPPDWDVFWGEGMMGASVAEILRDDPLLQIIVPPPTTEEGKKALNRSFILIGIAHEGAAGHLCSYLLQKGRGNLVRLMTTYDTGLDDRWTFYWEQALREEGIRPTPVFGFYQEYVVYWRALRHVVDVKLHCGLMTYDEAVDMLGKDVGMSPVTARQYTKAIAMLPGYFSSFIIGKQQLCELREHAQARRLSQYSHELFHQWVGEAGPIPYNLLKREIDERIRLQTGRLQ
jgi:hypothetical protein